MSDLDAIYDDLAAGTAAEPAPRSKARYLQRMAMQRARSTDPTVRLGALRVAAAIGPAHGLAITRELIRDPDAAVRRHAFNQAVAARTEGIALLRMAAEGPDPELAADAIDLLSTLPDAGAGPVMQRLAASGDPRVRAAAVRLLGRISGPGALPRIRPLLDDADEAVRAAAAEAIDRLAGGGAPIPAGQWWDDGAASPFPSPPVSADATPQALPERVAPEAEPPPPSPTPDDRALVPTRSPSEPSDDAHGPEAELAEGAPLPARMPTEARALLRLLGMVRDADRATVLDHLGPIWSDAVQVAGRYRVGSDEALGRGLAIAGAVMGGPSWLVRLRPLLAAPEARVREAAIGAFGAHGGISALPQVGRMLDDADPAVRLAAVRAVYAVCARSGRPDLVRQSIGARTKDADEAVRREVERVLADG